MPRNVRNFWIEARIDGRATKIAAGPVRKDGGFDLTIKIRDKGEVREAIDVIGRAHDDGTLTITVRPYVELAHGEIEVQTNR